jgi:hypothetical protein
MKRRKFSFWGWGVDHGINYTLAKLQLLQSLFKKWQLEKLNSLEWDWQ